MRTNFSWLDCTGNLLVMCCCFFVGGNVSAAPPLASKAVRQPLLDVPVAYDVDVMVVGGTTAHVAAAIAAKQSGATTLLITPLPYLGDDLAGTLELWADPSTPQEPLSQALLTDPHRAMPSRDFMSMVQSKSKLHFTYRVSESIDGKHPETPQKNRLCDGIVADPTHNSLQINGDASVIANLGTTKPVGVVSTFVFFRGGDFVVDKVEVAHSSDGKTWKPLGIATLSQDAVRTGDGVEEFRLTLTEPVRTRHLKITVRKTSQSNRLLLSEIVILPNISDIPSNTRGVDDAVQQYRLASRPMHVKHTLDKSLRDAQVPFLFGVYETGAWESQETASVQGVLIQNRAGTQAIIAKRVLRDMPTDTSSIRSEPSRFFAQFVVLGGEPQRFRERAQSEFSLLRSWTVEEKGEPFQGQWPNRAKTSNGVYPIFCYTFEVSHDIYRECKNGNLSIKNQLEEQIRLATYHPEQQFTSDIVVLRSEGTVPVSLDDRIRGGKRVGNEAAAAVKSVAVPSNTRSQAVEMIHAKSIPKQSVDATPPAVLPTLEIRCSLDNVKPYQPPLTVLRLAEQAIPVVGEYDVVVVGGGTTGAPAGIAAARRGAKTLVLEYLHDLGGTGTAGAISNYWFGNRVGFCQEVDGGRGSWVIEQKMYWWRKALADAGADVWYGVLGTGAIVDMVPEYRKDSPQKNIPCVKGVVIATSDGPRAILAHAVIDATGSGDMAIAAGATPQDVDGLEIAIQGAGLPPRDLGASYTNTDYMYVDETDVADATHVFVYSKEKFPKAFDLGKLLDTRERRRIVGDFSFTALDQINLRTYPDTIYRSTSNYDSHGYTVDPYFSIEHPDHEPHICDVPYRSSLPRGVEGILVGGLATSCHRDALPLIRMQPDLQNQGYALGCIAAAAAKEQQLLRDVNIKLVQSHLVEIGNLPASVISDDDNYGKTLSSLPNAVKQFGAGGKGAALILWYSKESQPLLQQALAAASLPQERLRYAMLLAACGDATGAGDLIAAIESYTTFDPGWNFRGMGQFGWSSSQLDRYIMLLGRTRDQRGTKVIAQKLDILTAESDFSHHRACALALEMIGDKSAAPLVAAHLKKRGMMGYVHRDLETAIKWDQADAKGSTAEKSRRDSLLEIGFARVLYRLGDVDGLGQQILGNYAEDVRGHFSRHARKVLSSTPDVE